MGGAWRPWRALRDRDDIDLVLVDFPPGPVRALCARQGDGDVVILIDRRLPPAERLAALAHELVHVERGGAGHDSALPAPLAATVAREEARVDRIAAARLVPELDLRRYLEARLSADERVEAWEVADEFGVDDATAARAMTMIDQRRTA